MGAPSWINIDEVDNVLKMDDFITLKPDSILSQYAASPRINGLIDIFQQAMDASGDIDLFYNNLFNPETATGTSLDVWGRILAISRSLKSEGTQTTWGDDYYKLLLLYKALANISSCDAATLNADLTSLFGCDVFLADDLDMSIRVVFLSYLSAEQLAILTAYGLLCRGAGVLWNYYQIDADNTFGFDGSGLQPFNQGIFDVYGVQEV